MQEEKKQEVREYHKKTYILYPRTSAVAWNNRGQLVTFAYLKYDFSKLEKSV
jgi:hypothetical protein